MPKKTVTPRARVEAALRKQYIDKIPFTIYEYKLPQCSVERDLRNRGLCIVNRHTPCFSVKTPNVRVTKSSVFDEKGHEQITTYFETPYGTLNTVHEPAGFTSWTHAHMFKNKEDYKALEFYLNDQNILPAYDAFLTNQQMMGEDIILRGGLGSEPLQSIISGFMDTAIFAYEWMDNRDEILKLYNILVEKRRQTYKIAAESPALHFNYGGNVTPEIIGLDTFRKYYVPHYNEAAEVLHKKSKFIGVHFDANCKLLKDDIAGTGLDYIEAFTPAPDTDMTMAEARKAWPCKVLWINYPSSVHLQPPEQIKQTALDLIDAVKNPEGFIIGITEDIPENLWQNSLCAIMDAIEERAGC